MTIWEREVESQRKKEPQIGIHYFAVDAEKNNILTKKEVCYQIYAPKKSGFLLSSASKTKKQLV